MVQINLNKYGLNSYESEAYLTMLRLGVSTASEISKQSKVPHGKIYPTLDSLQTKGFIHKFEGTPARFCIILLRNLVERLFGAISVR